MKIVADAMVFTFMHKLYEDANKSLYINSCSNFRIGIRGLFRIFVKRRCPPVSGHDKFVSVHDVHGFFVALRLWMTEKSGPGIMAGGQIRGGMLRARFAPRNDACLG